MDRSVALNKLKKILGKNLGYRVDANAPSKDERAAAQAELIATHDRFEKLKEQREARFQAVLAADQEYQRLKAECTAERDRREKLAAISRQYKFTVGTTSSMFFMVKAEGDSWEEILTKLKPAKVNACAG